MKKPNQKALVFLHGWGNDRHCFNDLSFYFKDEFSVLTLDLPGFGEAPLPKRPWGTKDYARYARERIDKKSIIIGYSFGGRVAIQLAAEHPELVEKLVLIASAGLRKFSLPRIWRGYFRKYSRDYLLAGAMQPTFIKIVREDLSQLLKKIKVPTLLLWGERDSETPLWIAKQMRKLAKNSKLIILPGADHWSVLASPQVAYHIKKFI